MHTAMLTAMLVSLTASPVVAQEDLNEQFRSEIRRGNYANAERLLENRDVDPDAQDNDAWTALMYASRSDRPELVTLLLKAGVKLDLQNEDGETALIVAVKRGRVDSARLLLMAGADIEIEDERRRTALDWALDRNRTYLAQIIRIASQPTGATVTVAEQPVTFDTELLSPPKVVHEVPPLYTEEAFDRRIEGRVVLKVIVRKDGTVGPIRVHESLDSNLDAAAVAAVKQWLFEPARVDGEAINVLADVVVDFRILREPSYTDG
jgi:TonB family protein